jgi:SSS family solute:Na+ symporter
VMGVGNGSSSFVKDLPLIIAFVVLAAFTYTSGLRAPALIAFVKDLLVYIVVIVSVIYIPIKLGGYGHIFAAAQAHADETAAAAKAQHTKPTFAFLPSAKSYWAYATLALGSAMALFMYPHSVTGVLASKHRETIRRNTVALPLYSLMLAFIALLGFMAIADGIKTTNSRLAAPLLFRDMFPSWFAGVAYAAVAIGALVPPRRSCRSLQPTSSRATSGAISSGRKRRLPRRHRSRRSPRSWSSSERLRSCWA